MNKFSLSFLVVCLLTLLSFTQHNHNTINLCDLDNTAFKSGEKMNFKAFYSVSGIYVAAGSVEITSKLVMLNGKPTYHLKAAAQTLNSYDFIFKVRDTYESWVDTATLRPIKFLRDIKEGSYTKLEKVTFNHNTNKATTNKGTFKTNACVWDVVSALYAARNINVQNMKEGDKISFNLFIDGENFSISLKYLGKETKKTKFGTYKTIKMRPTLIKGNVFNGGENMTMWITDDDNHIPVRIESPIRVGKVLMDLSNVSGLANEFSSKVK
jgi:hypothetical protein